MVPPRGATSRRRYTQAKLEPSAKPEAKIFALKEKAEQGKDGGTLENNRRCDGALERMEKYPTTANFLARRDPSVLGQNPESRPELAAHPPCSLGLYSAAANKIRDLRRGRRAKPRAG